MAALLKVPSGLQVMLKGADTVEIPSGALHEVLSALDAKYPGLKDRLIDQFGEVQPFISIFVDGNDITYLQGLHTRISDGNEIDIVPAIAGGTY